MLEERKKERKKKCRFVHLPGIEQIRTGDSGDLVDLILNLIAPLVLTSGP